MSKFIGIITDRSYYQQYSQYDAYKNRTYYYRICPYCEEKVEDGWIDEDSGMTVAGQHTCKIFDEIDNHSLHLQKHIEFLYGLFEWGQFRFKRKELTQ